jgi:uncharacterized protein (DUF302 family)
MSFADALEHTRVALLAEGFGIITTVDMQKSFREKLSADFRPYVILGACNPPLAYKAMKASPEIGLLLPCNVTVDEEAPGRVVVRLVNPTSMLGVGGLAQAAAVREVAADAQARLARVAEALKRPATH